MCFCPGKRERMLPSGSGKEIIMSLNEEILKLADEYEDYIIACRRKVHTFAEVAMHENKTHQMILEEAEKLGLPYEEVPTTSVIVKMDTGRPGKVVALRADIDALPLEESETNLTGARTCRSEQPGTCHACGHDGHTAMLLGAMQVLFRLKDQLSGTVLFCFEEGEEPNSGVQALLKALEKYHVDYCWAIHVYAELEEGKMCVDPGARMAGAVVIDATFHGKSGHGSRPDLAANPIFCGANFLNNLCVAFGNQVTAGKTVTLGLTMFHGGDVTNVIPDRARIQGTYRFFDMEEGKKCLELTKQVAEHTAAMHKCTVEFAPDSIGGPTVTDPACAEIASRVLNEILPEGTVVHCDPWYAGESFRLWLEKYPGVFAFLGIKNEAEGYGAPHHNSKFDFNEKVLKTGAISTVRYAVEMLSQQ